MLPHLLWLISSVKLKLQFQKDTVSSSLVKHWSRCCCCDVLVDVTTIYNQRTWGEADYLHREVGLVQSGEGLKRKDRGIPKEALCFRTTTQKPCLRTRPMHLQCGFWT